MVGVRIVYIVVGSVESGLKITHMSFKYLLLPAFVDPVVFQLFCLSIVEGFEPLPLGFLLICVSLVLLVF